MSDELNYDVLLVLQTQIRVYSSPLWFYTNYLPPHIIIPLYCSFVDQFLSKQTVCILVWDIVRVIGLLLPCFIDWNDTHTLLQNSPLGRPYIVNWPWSVSYIDWCSSISQLICDISHLTFPDVCNQCLGLFTGFCRIHL